MHFLYQLKNIYSQYFLCNTVYHMHLAVIIIIIKMNKHLDQ